MNNVVVFNAEEFLALYPQFQNVFTPEQLGIFFNAACLLLDNTENSKVKDLAERWDSDVLSVNPDVLSVLIGINDVLNDNPSVDTVAFEKTYRDILTKSRT